MAVSRDILGMNARNFLYIRRYNGSSAKRVADDKLETKKVLLQNGIATPALLASFETRDQIRNFDWNTLPKAGFVIKPARGYGGAGILSVKTWEHDTGVSETGKEYTAQQLVSHLLDILEGAYSLQSLADKVLIEERISPDQFFRRLTPVGLPDIRIIVFNHVPVMAMLRLPTKESGEKANLHQGGLGIGIDLRTGITTYGVSKDKTVSRIPGTKLKVRGIKIPNWNELLLLSSRTQDVIGLGYAGIDIVIDAKLGPLVLEVNSRPGLNIQIANMTSLRTRLERVENMTIPSPSRGVEVAKSLFADAFFEQVVAQPHVLTVIQPVTIHGKERDETIDAKLDTGAYRTSLDKKLAKELGILSNGKKVFVKSASGQNERPTVNVSFTLAGKKISSIASVADRKHMKYAMIIGRQDLKGFLIKPMLHEEQKDTPEEKAEEH